MAFGQPRIEYKTNAQMRSMHAAGLVLSRALDAAVAAAAPGKTTTAEAACFTTLPPSGFAWPRILTSSATVQ